MQTALSILAFPYHTPTPLSLSVYCIATNTKRIKCSSNQGWHIKMTLCITEPTHLLIELFFKAD